MYKMIIIAKLILIFIFTCVSCQREWSRWQLNNEFRQWTCDNGESIYRDDLCDGRPHCHDGSDEIAEHCIHIQCPEFAFRCAYGACINGKYKCNGRRDCADNSDETRLLCYGNALELEKLNVGRCNSPDMTQCSSGECLQVEKRCDGKVDCVDGSDETVENCAHTFCPLYAFRCGYGGCIRGTAKCDGVKDCRDGSDEASELCNYPRHNTTIVPETTVEPSVDDGCRIPFNRKHLFVENAITKERVELGIHILTATILRFSCARKYNLVGAEENACLNNKWVYELPKCSGNCPNNIITHGKTTKAVCYYNNIKISCEGALPIGTKAIISCAPGYTSRRNEAPERTLTCDDDAEWDTNKFSCRSQCGKLPSDYNPAAVMPWDVSIFRRTFEPFYNHVCSGTIISHRIIVTAAICFSNSTTEAVYYNIVTGKYTRSYYQGDYIVSNRAYNVSQIILSNFMSYDDSPNKHQIAVLVLVNYLSFSEDIMPACLNWDIDPSDDIHEVIDIVGISTYKIVNVGSAITYSPPNSNSYVLSAIVDEIIGDKRASLVSINKSFLKFIWDYKRRYRVML